VKAPARHAVAGRGFTLLEVLAAVAVLALLYTALARAGVMGLRAEGNADRRLRAGLAADDRLALLESQILAGSAIPIGDTEDVVDEFVVKVSVMPLEMQVPTVPEKLAERARERVSTANDLRAAGPAAAAAAARGQPAGSLFGARAGGEPAPGRHIIVSVVWDDAGTEKQVRRETFGLDGQAAAPLLEALDAAAEQERDAAKGRRKRQREPEADQAAQPQPEAPTEDAPAELERRAP
jgi:prepilin-type N-terminal cleavage/methylation domain-containing protein